MPANIVPVDAWPANLKVAADGDAVSQATRTTVQQTYADAVTYLHGRSVEAVGGDYQVPIVPTSMYPAGWTQRWEWRTASNGWMNRDTAGADAIMIPLPPMLGASISSVTMYLDGDAGGAGPHGGLPGTMPTISLYQIAADAALMLSLVGTATDNSANVAAYEALHEVTYSPGAAQVFSHIKQYAVTITGETGANAINFALGLMGLKMTVVPT